MAMHPSGIGFGVTIVPYSSKVQSRGFLSTSIQTSLKGVRCYGSGHGKGPRDGVGVVIKRFI
jgi:hypothetical protein